MRRKLLAPYRLPLISKGKLYYEYNVYFKETIPLLLKAPLRARNTVNFHRQSINKASRWLQFLTFLNLFVYKTIVFTEPTRRKGCLSSKMVWEKMKFRRVKWYHLCAAILYLHNAEWAESQGCAQLLQLVRYTPILVSVSLSMWCTICLSRVWVVR